MDEGCGQSVPHIFDQCVRAIFFCSNLTVTVLPDHSRALVFKNLRVGFSRHKHGRDFRSEGCCSSRYPAADTNIIKFKIFKGGYSQLK